MADNSLAPPNMPWLWQPNGPMGQPNGLGPPMLNYAAPPNPAAPTVGQGVAQTAADVAQALPSWPSVEEQRRMLQPLPGWQGTAVDAAKQWAEGVMMGTTAPGDVPPPGIVAYHGSPHSFDQFDTSKIGTGEGAQAYGHGLYFAEQEPVAQQYRDQLRWKGADWNDIHTTAQAAIDRNGDRNAAADSLQSALDSTAAFYRGNVPAPQEAANEVRRQAIALLRSQEPITGKPPVQGSMYQVNIGADPEHFLDWDKPLSEQSQHVQDALKASNVNPNDTVAAILQRAYRNPMHGGDLVGQPTATPAEVTDALAQRGIPGIRYLDQGSRGAGQGTHNYVVFDPATIDILRKYGIAGLIAGGGAAAAATQQQQPSQ